MDSRLINLLSNIFGKYLQNWISLDLIWLFAHLCCIFGYLCMLDNSC